MAEFKFACQGCGQHIQCNELWSGQQIACPHCGAGILVPFLDAPPASAPSARAQPGPPVQRRVVANKPPFPVKKVIAWTVGAVAGFVIMSLILHKADSWQVGFDKKTKEMADHSSGGEMAHIANVYQVLDATDPAKMEQAQMRNRARSEKAVAEMMEQLKVQPDPTLTLPLATTQWGLDDSSAQFPSGRVHGSSAGQEFTPESIHVDQTAYGGILAFQQGLNTSADHEIFIYLNILPGADLAGKKWSVSKDTKAKDAFQIVKRWTGNPKFAPLSKTFGSGYTLRLEFGQPTRDWQPGQIYLALPDTNQTVLAGSFSLPTAHQGGGDLHLR